MFQSAPKTELQKHEIVGQKSNGVMIMKWQDK